jgi:GT2 family glycosyltransferase
MRSLDRFLWQFPLLLLSPFLLLLSLLALLVADLIHFLLGPKSPRQDSRPSTKAATIVIPNWNGKHLLEKYLSSVLAAIEDHPGSEVIVVDNGSTDGSAEFVRARHPEIRILALEKNLGFGGGSNAGFQSATNDIVVLLNNDMRVAPDFLAPLLEDFTDEKVFAVSCQIFFSDPNKVREETGLTQGWWEAGALRVRHRLDERVNRAFPCFYGGGGSCAFDRRKFLELGGFDSLLAPFYLEDTDIGYMAWKRGWKVLYEPRSRVFHEHRGTIGKRFTHQQIKAVLHKNFVLFCWKNIHEWRRLGAHFVFTFGGAWLSLLLGESPERATLLGIWKAFLQLPGAVVSRWRAKRLALVPDTEAFRRPLGGYYRDRFETLAPQPDPLRVLFVSPYPIYPPVHGGGVFMLQTCLHLAELCELHLVALLDRPEEEAAHQPLTARCASAEFLVRTTRKPRSFASIQPHAVWEFDSDDLHWLIHRKIFMDRIDVLQLEYLPMGQYFGHYRRIATALFEHDVYFQSVARLLPSLPLRKKAKAALEYMRALHYELRLLPQLDRVQFCSRDNASYVAGFLPGLRDQIDDNLRSGIDVARYHLSTGGREPFTMLFLGSFRHHPNLQALTWLVELVLPRVIAARPEARLIVVGSEAPPPHAFPRPGGAIELRGFVEDVRDPLSRYSVFVCPIRSGSGIRVKLLEAFASGIPVVSTRVGAEGLATADGDLCILADDPDSFSRAILRVFEAPEQASEMALRARAKVEADHHAAVLTPRLAASYGQIVAAKRREGRADS